MFPWKPTEKDLSRFGCWLTFLGIPRIVPVSASIITWLSSPCVSSFYPFSLYKDTNSIRLRAYFTPLWLHLTYIFITSPKILFPNKFIFADSRGQGFKLSFQGTIQSITSCSKRAHIFAHTCTSTHTYHLINSLRLSTNITHVYVCVCVCVCFIEV